jgi:hypothetical protein
LLATSYRSVQWLFWQLPLLPELLIPLILLLLTDIENVPIQVRENVEECSVALYRGNLVGREGIKMRHLSRSVSTHRFETRSGQHVLPRGGPAGNRQDHENASS